MKMRGVDHDTRVFEVEVAPDGIHTHPRLRTHPGEFVPDDHLATEVEGLDALLGGGLVRGGTALLEHDGRASPHALVVRLLSRAVEEGMAAVVVPPVELPPKRLRNIVDQRVGDMDELMDDDRLFLVDYPNIWENTRRNVFKPTEHESEGPEAVFETISERRGDRPVFSAINVEAQLPVLGEAELRQARFWQEENFFGPADTSLYFFNPATMNDRLAAFYRNASWQVLRTWISDNALQYVTLKKSPSGYMGSTRLLEYTDEPPYLRVQRPPGAGASR
jgi:circadian clock protein KaiC